MSLSGMWRDKLGISAVYGLGLIKILSNLVHGCEIKDSIIKKDDVS